MDNILILGAHSEIALACADRFAMAGHNLILAARKKERLADRRQQLVEKFDITADLVSFDVTNISSHPSFWKSLEARVDVVIVAIGHLDQQLETSHDPNLVQTVLQANYLGIVEILNLVASTFKLKRKGTIIGISSVAGERGRQSNMFYGSAKAGLTAYLSGLRNWLQPHNVHVATIKPGYVQTKMIAHLKTPKFLTASRTEVAEAIYRKAYRRRRNVIFVKPIWRLIMLIICQIPEPIFKRLRL